MMLMILWTRHLLEVQGCKVADSIIYQDSKSAILLERNGKAFSSKQIKHIQIRYFFITDWIANGVVKTEWCSTADLVADFMTKPMQGCTFRTFHDFIIGKTERPKQQSLAHK